MMSLKVLKDNRDALLLAEVVALLHDVGKLSGLFIDQQSSQPSPNSTGFEHERAVQKLNGFVDNHFLQNLQSIRLRNTLNFTLIPNNSRIGQVLDLILHHDNSNHSAFLVRLLNGCDGADSGADKGTTRSQGLPRWAKQPSSDTFIATAFGKEDSKLRIDTVRIDDIRQKLSKKVGKRLDPQVFLGKAERKRLEILRMARYAYQRALGETRRSANDVTLWDHSFSVATLYKTSLATLLLCNRLNINHLLRWRLLRVNFDVLGLYAKAIKIADLLGYQRVVDKACETVKQLVEEEYPLGNEIYRDSTGIYFTFPDLDLPADLAQEIRRRIESVEMELAPRIAVTMGDGNTATDQLKSILGKARREALEALAQPFDSQQLSDCWQQQWTVVGTGQWEVCPVCRLRPMREGKEACETCMQRRMSRIKTWESDPAQTIWIDEIADHNDRVALIVGRFGLDNWLSGDLVQTMLVKAVQNNPKDCVPKNPSPARLRRVWETCQRFWTETVEREIILARHHSHGAQNPGLRCTRLLLTPDRTSGWRENVPYDGVVNGGAISLLWRKDVQQFITISNLELAGDIQPGQTIVVSEPDRPQQISFVIQGTAQATGKMGTYTPYLRLLASPDQFLALVPAAAALEIAKNIRQEYQKQFGKVQNRLPLFLGLVFFQRKISLTAVMDTARRMLDGAKLNREEWQVECSCPSEDAQRRYLRLSREQQRIVFEIPVKMGDGQTDDLWYPYFFFQGSLANCSLYFRLNGHSLVHARCLREEDRVLITPSRFTYLFLENTARRFRFDPERDVMLLDELPRLMKMWDDLKGSGITDTGLRNVQALLEHKGETWGRGEEFEHLACTTLKEAGLFERKDQNGNPLSDVVTPQDVVSGRFARCLELHLYILKLKIKESQGGVPTGCTQILCARA
jgi:hypothetical protein